MVACAGGGERRINWGWATVPPASTQTLPRHITFNAAARCLQQYPVEEVRLFSPPVRPCIVSCHSYAFCLRSRFSFLVSRFSLLVARCSLLIARCSLLDSRFSFLDSRFSILVSCFLFLVLVGLCFRIASTAVYSQPALLLLCSCGAHSSPHSAAPPSPPLLRAPSRSQPAPPSNLRSSRRSRCPKSLPLSR